VVGKPELGLYNLGPPVLDSSGLAKLYGYAYVAVDSEASLAAATKTPSRRTLIDLKLDPSLKPAAASRHF
jgi:hypothetical protein